MGLRPQFSARASGILSTYITKVRERVNEWSSTVSDPGTIIGEPDPHGGCGSGSRLKKQK